MKVLAPAKINLFLSVGALRPDGLHEIESVMQSVSLSDTLSIEPASEFSLDVSPSGAVPESEDNLIVKAARALWSSVGRPLGASVSLTKSIPVAAGLGGGSADAAAALVALSSLHSLGLSRKALEKIGAAVGADVPFCVRGGTCGARGAGEVLSPLPVRSPLWWVIVVPPGSLSTASVYEEFGSGSGREPFEVADALARGDVTALGAALHNDLEVAAASLMPSLSSIRSMLMDAGAEGAVMSGSGPSWCALARDEEHARVLFESMKFERKFVVNSLDYGAKIER